MMRLCFLLLAAVPALPVFAADAKVQPLAEFGADADPRESGWKGGNLDDDKKDFEVMGEPGQRFVRSTQLDGVEAKYLYKRVDWNVIDLPYLRWRWRVQKFPTDAKVTDKKKSDAGAQVYLVWQVGRRKNVLKYFWGTTDKVGDVLKQESIVFGNLLGTVLRSGPPTNEWVWEERNIVDDYKAAFGGLPPKKVGALAFLSDGDETKSASQADYADFEARKEPSEPAPKKSATKTRTGASVPPPAGRDTRSGK